MDRRRFLCGLLSLEVAGRLIGAGDRSGRPARPRGLVAPRLHSRLRECRETEQRRGDSITWRRESARLDREPRPVALAQRVQRNPKLTPALASAEKTKNKKIVLMTYPSNHPCNHSLKFFPS